MPCAHARPRHIRDRRGPFGLGAGPGEIAAIGADAREWLRAQLKARAPQPAVAQLRPSQETLAQALELRRELQARKSAARLDPAMADAQQQRLGKLLKPVDASEVTARIQLAASTERPFVERLTQFWANHFAVSVDKQLLAGLAGGFEREAIRPHVLGRFSDLLVAARAHPAMLLYLDNASLDRAALAGGRPARRRQDGRRIGINENLAREILELHTLGVGGGYTQSDVTTSRKCSPAGPSAGARAPQRRRAR